MTIKEMGVREFLFKQGATQAQLDSKVADMLIKGITNDEISTSETARAEIARMKTEITKADHKADTIIREARKVEERYSHLTELLEQVEISAAERTISDPKLVDSVNAFAQMLESVREVFGTNNMTEAVICKAIEAASYGYWRSVMGGKYQDESNKRNRGRNNVVL